MNDREQINEKLIQIFTEECVDIFEAGGCVIHFPLFDIENEHGNFRAIENLYVKLRWSYGIGDKVNTIENFTTNIQGLRTTFNLEDINARYIHSHLSSLSIEEESSVEYTAYCDFQDFCLGSDDLYNTLVDLHLGFSLDKFIILLNMLDEFVRWESLAGGPYQVIEEIPLIENGFYALSKENKAPPVSYSLMLKEFLTKATEEEIQELSFLHTETSTTIMSTTKFFDLVENLFSNFDFMLDIFNPIYKYGGKYYKESSEYAKAITIAKNITWHTNFKFKDELVLCNIYFDEEASFDIKLKGKIVPHPDLIHTFLIDLETTLHFYLTKTDTWKLKKELPQEIQF